MVSKSTLKEAGIKAEILIEALPYIQRFNRKIIIIKYGGSAMADDALKKSVIEDVVLLKLVGFKPIICHGGGKEISRWAEKTGKKTKFIDGFRITDHETMEIAEMVLGKVNKELVSMIQSLGIKAAGISGKDGHLLKTVKKKNENLDMGFVGEVSKVDPKILFDLLEKDFLPVVCSLGMDEDFVGHNVNADEAACAIASEMKAEKLAFLSDVEGIYKDADDPESIISELYVNEAEELIREGSIRGGMIPKTENCIRAVKNGVSRVHILDGRIPHSLLLEIFTDKGLGTAILNEKENRYYKE